MINNISRIKEPKLQDLSFDIIKINDPLLVSTFDVKYVSTGSKGGNNWLD